MNVSQVAALPPEAFTGRLAAASSRRNVAITGATGYIGGSLVSALSQDHDIQAISRASGADVTATDIRDHLAGCDVVVHLAGQTRATGSEILRTNITGTLQVALAAIEEGAALVLASSAATYHGRGDYAFSKIIAEHLVARLAAQHGLRVAVLRIFNVFGPGETQNVVGRFMAQDPIQINGDGTSRFDFIHVDDVTAAISRCLNPQGLFMSDIGTGKGTTLRELADAFHRPVVYVPAGDPRGNLESVAQNIRIDGWHPDHDVIQWVRKQTGPDPAQSMTRKQSS